MEISRGHNKFIPRVPRRVKVSNVVSHTTCIYKYRHPMLKAISQQYQATLIGKLTERF